MSDISRANRQPFQKITAEQLEQMPVILNAHQYQALDEAMHLVTAQATDPNDPDNVDFRDSPWLEQVYIRLSVAALAPWNTPANQPLLSQIGLSFSDTDEHMRLLRKINNHLAEMDRQKQQGGDRHE